VEAKEQSANQKVVASNEQRLKPLKLEIGNSGNHITMNRRFTHWDVDNI